MKKRILSMLLAIVMVVGLLPTHALATDCTHETMQWDGASLDMYHHLMTCKACSYSNWQRHSDTTSDSKCDVCGILIDENNSCVHDGMGAWDGENSDAFDHKITCSICGGYWEGHYDESGNDSKCDVCEYDMSDRGLPSLPDETAGKIIVLMADSYGDGWNGAAIKIYENNDVVNTATIENGFSGTFEMEYDSTAAYRFAWVEGEYDDECSYEIYINGEEYTGELDTEEGGSGGGSEDESTLPPLPDDTAGKIIVLMADSYGDGWNGAAIRIYENGTLAGTATIEGEEDSYSDTFEMAYDSAAEYRFAWVEGDYDDECSYEIYINGEEYTGELDTEEGGSGDDEEVGSVTITGYPVVGQTLTAVVSGFDPATELTYQWYRVVENTTLIAGATNSTYTLTEDDLGQMICCNVNGVASNYIGSVISSGTVKNNLWVGSVQVTKDTLSGNGWEYDPDTNTLTLNNAKIDGTQDVSSTTQGAGIYAESDLNLVLKGVNTVTGKQPYEEYEDEQTGETGRQYSNVTIAIAAMGALRISGDGTLNAKTEVDDEEASMVSIGIMANESITITGGTVNATGDLSAQQSMGISSGAVTISGGTVNAEGGQASVSFGLMAATLTITGGELMATSSEEMAMVSVAVMYQDSFSLGSYEPCVMVGPSENEAKPWDESTPLMGDFDPSQGEPDPTKLNRYVHIFTPEVASVTMNGVTTICATLADAVAAVSKATEADAAVVKLLDDIELSERQHIESGVFTLDLNGFTIRDRLSDALYVGGGAVIFITDTSENETGAIIGRGAGVDVDDGTVTIQGGTICGEEVSSSYYAVRVDQDGTLNIEGGSLVCDAIGVFTDGGAVTITGGKIISGDMDIQNYFGPPNIKLKLAEDAETGATFPGGITVRGATLQDILGNGVAYWQDGKQITLTEGQTTITSGDVVIRAACTHAGNTNIADATCMASAVCAECGQSYGEKDTSNHTEQNTTVKGDVSATCGTAGYTGDTYCECGEKIASGETIPATGNHVDGEDKNHDCDNCPATDVDDGHHGGTATCMAGAICAECGQSYGVKNTSNHTRQNTTVKGDVSATCGTAGYTGDTYCECGEKIASGETIPATGKHVDGDDKNHDCDNCPATNVDGDHHGGTATCMAGAICAECGQSYGEKNTSNHTQQNITVKGDASATCGTAGYTGDTYCECGEKITSGKIIPATGKHVDGDDKNHDCDNCPATNVDGGHHGGTATCMAGAICAECGQSYGEKNTSNHTQQNITVKGDVSATCGTAGYTGDTYCECGEKIASGKTIPATGKHSYTAAFDWTADCSSATVTASCGVCEDKQTLNCEISSRWDAETDTLTFTASAGLDGETFTDTQTIKLAVVGGKLSITNSAAEENEAVDMIIMVAGYTSGGQMTGCQIIDSVTGVTKETLTGTGDTIKVFFLKPGSYAPLSVCAEL